MASSIASNLVASYYFNLPFQDEGLLTARESWSARFSIKSPLWVTADTTQFTKPGWVYLAHGIGVSLLNQGGSFVTIRDSATLNFSIIIEKTSHDHSVCIRPELPPYNTSSEGLDFVLEGDFANTKGLNLWRSCIANRPTQPEGSTYFENLGMIQVHDGKFSIFVEVDCMYTLSTISTANSPSSRLFPIPYEDDFDQYDIAETSLAKFFSDMSTSFGIFDSKSTEHGFVLRQRKFISFVRNPS